MNAEPPPSQDPEEPEAPEVETPPEPPTPKMAKREPLISGGAWKAIGLLLAAAVIGVTTFLLVAGLGDLDLPDVDLEVPETSEPATNLEDVTLEDTTIDGGTIPEVPGDTDLPPEADKALRQAQKLGRCVQGAQGDVEAIQRCFERFQPG